MKENQMKNYRKSNSKNKKQLEELYKIKPKIRKQEIKRWNQKHKKKKKKKIKNKKKKKKKKNKKN